MLDEEEKGRQAQESEEAARALETALIAAAVACAMRDASPYEAATELAAVASGRSKRLSEAVSRDLRGAIALNAVREAAVSGYPVDEALALASESAAEAAREARRSAADIAAAMRRAAETGYYEVRDAARGLATSVPHERLMADAVTALAERGLHATTYVRSDGRTVRVPVDVGIRNAVLNAGKARQDADTLAIARETGCGLVAVSTTWNARESHAAWQGRVYQLEGSGKYPNFDTSCHYNHVTRTPTDPVEGYRGYNCGHSIAIYREGQPFPFRDPLDGTGLTPEQARSLSARQRRLERKVRAEKRAVRVLEENGLDASEARGRVRRYQGRLRALVSRNPALRRQPWRESLYDRAVREAAMASAGKAKWPSVGTRLGDDAYREIRDLAAEHGIALQGFRGGDADPRVLRTYVNAAISASERVPSLKGTARRPLTLCSEPMDDLDFARTSPTSPHVIRLNRASMRSEEALAAEYQAEVDAGWFVRGTTYEAVVYHELGHRFEYVNKIDGDAVARSIISGSDKNLEVTLTAELSAYASTRSVARGSGRGRFEEIVSEVFAAWLSGTGNPLARRLVGAIIRKG